MRRPRCLLSAFLYFLATAGPAMGVTLVLDTQLDGISPGSQHITQRAAPRASPPATEKILLDSLLALRQRRMDTALRGMESLIETHPEFRLAQLIYGDLLLSKDRSITDIGHWPNGPQSEILGLREEARQRIKHHLHRPGPNTLPSYLIRPGRNTARLIMVDISRSRLHVLENHGADYSAGMRLRGDYYASVGKNGFPKQSEGDQKTPVGIYVTAGSISTDKLPDRYGAAAFPIDYPNEWDRRLARTGHGIWIHGVSSNTYSRPPRSSDGCIVMANEDLRAIEDVLSTPNIPVIIAERVSWVSQREITAHRHRFEAQFHRWRRDWESLDHARYARHYAWDFRNENQNRTLWLRHKRRANAEKTYIRLGISNLSIFAYPGEPDTLMVTFHQDYRSSNYNGLGTKRQYWRWESNTNKNSEKDTGEENGVWRIVYEDTR